MPNRFLSATKLPRRSQATGGDYRPGVLRPLSLTAIVTATVLVGWMSVGTMPGCVTSVAFAGCGDYLVFRAPVTLVKSDFGSHQSVQLTDGDSNASAVLHAKFAESLGRRFASLGAYRSASLSENRGESPCSGPQCGHPIPQPFRSPIPASPNSSTFSSQEHPVDRLVGTVCLPTSSTSITLAIANEASREQYLAFPPFRPPRSISLFLPLSVAWLA